MGTNIAIVGGDLRIIKLANMLANDGNLVYTYNKLGLIDEVKVSEKKKIVPVICLDKTFIKAGDGSINNPYVVE